MDVRFPSKVDRDGSEVFRYSPPHSVDDRATSNGRARHSPPFGMVPEWDTTPPRLKDELVNIVVCVKHVPDTEAAIKIASDGKGIEPAGWSDG